ncbi:MAG: YheT family hydrolase [Blastocatellia bacterium]
MHIPDSVSATAVDETPRIRVMMRAVADRLAARPFVAPRWLRNGHAMTIVASQWPRTFNLSIPGERRVFQTEPDTQVVTFCHWQPDRHRHPTVLVTHGLEGHAERAYVLGTTEKALRAGFNVVRQNVRNCGGTIHLTPTLYHSGLITDLRAITTELIERDGLGEIYLIGYSMGGNQSLKFAAALGAAAPPQLAGVAAISPAIDLAACCDAISRPDCFIYEYRFVRSLKKTMLAKNQVFPGMCDPERVGRIRTLREFDDVVTGPSWGFGDSNGYYRNASSRPHLGRIRVPALLLTAQDDPFIPYESFLDPLLAANPWLIVEAPAHGGHTGFMATRESMHTEPDAYWAESQAVEFCRLISRMKREG